LVNISLAIAESMTSSISCAEGQMSLRNTSLPSGSLPNGSVVMSTSIEPARAYATTSGGDAR
jgi:hypothetical protein